MLAAYVVPVLYRAYMRLVALTSRIDREGLDRLDERLVPGTGTVMVTLHQGVVEIPYFIRDRGLSPIASLGDAGEIISKTLEGMGFRMLRGGSSKRASRRAPVLGDAVAYARESQREGFCIVLTPDGSSGPAGAVKPGAAVIAARTGAPVLCLNIQARRAVYLDTWDRTAIPLPFNEIRLSAAPLVEAPEDDDAAIEACRLEIESALHSLHTRAFEHFGQSPIPELSRWSGESD